MQRRGNARERVLKSERGKLRPRETFKSLGEKKLKTYCSTSNSFEVRAQGKFSYVNL